VTKTMSRPRAGPPVFIERKAPEAQDVTRGLLVAGVRHVTQTTLCCGWLLLGMAVGCGSEGTECCDDDGLGAGGAACTPEAQQISGTVLNVSTVELAGGSESPGSLEWQLLTGPGDVDAVFPNGAAPASIADSDFAADRVVLGPWNPSLEFAVDDARDLVIGAMPFCSGADLGPVGYVVHGTTRNTLRVASCPYTGPVPCNAP